MSTATEDNKPAALAPDPQLRKPKRALPPGTIDCHAHIFDRFEQYPLAGVRKYNPPLCTREAWFALHEALGIARGVQVHGSPYGFDNSITLDFVLTIPCAACLKAGTPPLPPKRRKRKRRAKGRRKDGILVVSPIWKPCPACGAAKREPCRWSVEDSARAAVAGWPPSWKDTAFHRARLSG